MRISCFLRGYSLGLILAIATGCGRSEPPAPPAEINSNTPATKTSAQTLAPADAEDAKTQTPPNGDVKPLPIVVWISVDGLRGDYVDRANTPFLQRMIRKGAYSRKLAPVFPSLTFPTHVSQCTGALVKDHGIVLNALYDMENDRRWSYPNDNSAILCEPIWNTATRQGRRTAVFDWPVSQKQTGPHAAAYFDQAYDPDLSDRRRLERLWEVWSADDSPQPLQLLMGYFPGVDVVGHKFGPNAPQTRAAVERADRLLQRAFDRCLQIVERKHGKNATLYFIISTDHGMEEIHTLVDLVGLLGDAFTPQMRKLTSGSVANIYLDFIKDEQAKPLLARNLVSTLRRHEFVRAYLRDELPAHWGYNCPGRTGDVVVSIAPGYFFSEAPGPPLRPVDPQQGPLGMHGYPVEECPAMYGLLTIWCSGEPLGGLDLGEVDSRRLHATVAAILGIAPPPTALPDSLNVTVSFQHAP
jgi:hypothetical protein